MRLGLGLKLGCDNRFFKVTVFVNFLLSDTDGKEKWPMRSIPCRFKMYWSTNVLIHKKCIRFEMRLSMWAFVSSGPDGKEKWPMGLIPSLSKMCFCEIDPKEICPVNVHGEWSWSGEKNDLWDQSQWIS